MKRSLRRSRLGGRELLVLLLALLVAARFAWQAWFGEAELPPPREGPHRLVRVVDGDTLIVAPLPPGDEPGGTGEFRLRLLGVDAPESVRPGHPVEPFGPEAAEFTRAFTARGTLHLQYDNRREDQYGRRLAYVFVGDKLLNEELARAGLARVRAYRGDSAMFERRLKGAEQEARRAGRGIWGAAEQP